MSTLQYNFSGRNVLVTGASRGIGYGVADGFAKARANVTILASGEGVHEAATQLSRETGNNISALQCDITDKHQVKEALATFERIDVLINNAGLERITPLDDPDDGVEEVFARIIDINVNGTFLVSRYAVTKMQAGGRIIFTSSIWGRTAVGEFSAYCASKHANIGFMRSLAHELGPRAITVNAVCPGWVKTEAAMRSLANMSKRASRSEEDLLAEIISAQVLDGLMQPEDMSALYMFLASDEAKDITGQAYGLDRGEVMA